MKTTKESRDSLRATIERSKFPEVGDGTILLLMDDIDTLKSALEQVEWVEDEYTWCPWCKQEWLIRPKHIEHFPDCPRQLALKEGE